MKNLAWLTNDQLKQGDRGYTIIELLVIVIMLGVLAAIAAPSWLGFINRQRVRTVNDRVFQSLRLAQSEAKRTKQEVRITFNQSNPPKVIFTPPLATGGSEQTLNAGGEIKPGTIVLSTNATAGFYDDVPPIPANTIVFDYQGNVKKLPPSTNPAITNARFVVLVSTVNGSPKQCAIVETLIGGMRTGEGNDCQIP